MAHIRVRTGYALIVKLLRKLCELLVGYRAYQDTIQTSEAMTAWDGLLAACELFLEVVQDPRTIEEA